MRVLLFANTDWYIYHFRLPLAQALAKSGNDVVLLSPPGSFCERFATAGLHWLAFPFARAGMNPILELKTLWRLTSVLRAQKPNLCHFFTIKCVLYGGLACRFLDIPAVCSITGAGHVFTTNSVKNALLRPLIRMLYRFSLSRAHVIFQNPHDAAAFATHGLTARSNVSLIRGSGVDMERFRPQTDVLRLGPPRVVFVGRLLREKGIYELIACAQLLHERGVAFALHVLGDGDDGNPTSASAEDAALWRQYSFIKFWGHSDDVLSHLRSASIAVLPSYREGTPRSLVEAAACGLPLVATDVPGCREICRHGDNGLLVPPRDPQALATAILKLLRDPEMRKRMGKRSREIAVAEFSEEKVIRETLAVYEAALKMRQ